MDTEEKENKVYLISTIVIFILMFLGFCYFTKQFTGISSVICMFTIPLLPIYYLIQNRKYIKRITVEDETYSGIQEYAEMLRDLSDDIEDYILEEEKEHAKTLRDLPDDRKYDDDVYEEHYKIEYLKHVKNEIVSIAKDLKELRENGLF